MSTNKKQTSSKVASLAAKTLKSDASSKIQKQLAAAALAQSRTDKQTGPQLEDIAAKVLASDKYAEDTKTLAASVLAQSNRER